MNLCFGIFSSFWHGSNVSWTVFFARDCHLATTGESHLATTLVLTDNRFLALQFSLRPTDQYAACKCENFGLGRKLFGLALTIGQKMVQWPSESLSCRDLPPWEMSASHRSTGKECWKVRQPLISEGRLHHLSLFFILDVVLSKNSEHGAICQFWVEINSVWKQEPATTDIFCMLFPRL